MPKFPERRWTGQGEAELLQTIKKEVSMKGICILLAYAAVMLLATVTLTRKEKGVEGFCVGDRNAGWLLSSLSIAATWVWAPALFTSTENAYMKGFAGLFWFLVPNVLCLVIFIPFAKQIRREMPFGITLSGYMAEKYQSVGVKRVYLFQLIGLSVLSTGVQLLAGSKILSSVTGLPFWAVTVILAVIGYSYSQFSGIRASIMTDAIQIIFMLAVCAAFVFSGIRQTGGDSLLRGLAGYDGTYGSIISPAGLDVFLGFGLPTAIGLISGPFGDQSFWQRVFSIKERYIGRAFLIGALVFGVVPLSMGILGFLGAGAGYQVQDAAVINFEIISWLFPAWAAVPFLFMIVSGLLSTVDSNLCAVSSLTTDIVKGNNLKITKAAMLMLLAAGIGIANIPGLTVTHLFLFYGTLRASTLLPTVMTLKGVKLKADGIIAGVIIALCLGLPVFACGALFNRAVYKTIGSLLTVLSSGIVAALISRREVWHCGKYTRKKTIHKK